MTDERSYGPVPTARSSAFDPAAKGADAKHAEAGIAAERCTNGADESWMSSEHSQSSPVSAGISRTPSHRERFDDSSHDSPHTGNGIMNLVMTFGKM